jgi:hypothetical protein
MKPTSRSLASGPICVALSTPRAKRSSSCCRPDATSSARRCFCGWRYPAVRPHRGSAMWMGPAYARAITELKRSGELGRRCRWRTSLNEQHHRARSPLHQEANHGQPGIPISCRRAENDRGYEAMDAIPKGQIRWLLKGDAIGQREFIHALFGIAQ